MDFVSLTLKAAFLRGLHKVASSHKLFVSSDNGYVNTSSNNPKQINFNYSKK
jgi:hypothetical protein